MDYRFRTGQIILAVGTSSGQTPLQKLGKLEFVRLSNIETVLNPIIAIHYDGSTDPTYHTPGSRLELDALPMSFTLFPAHPNPFNPETTIEFYAPYKTNIDTAIIRSSRSKSSYLAKRKTVGWIS